MTTDELLQELEKCEQKHGKVTESLLREDDDFINPYYVKKEFETLSEAKLKADLDNVGQIHLTSAELEEINATVRENEYIRDLLVGLLMGDGWISEDPGKSGHCFQVEMINKSFLQWLESELGNLVSYMKMKATAAELAEKNRKSGYVVNENEYNDIYTLRSRRVPALGELRAWYDTGEKVFPRDLSLNPTKLKMWYCCDGSYNTVNDSAVIYLSNEVHREDFLNRLFKEIGIDIAVGEQQVHFSVGQTQALFDYIGEPPSGFEYKWGR